MTFPNPNEDTFNDDDDEASVGLSDDELGRSNHGSTTSTPEKLANKEDKYVKSLRLGLFGVLLLSATGICVLVYNNAKGAERDSFERDFAGIASKIVLSFSLTLQHRLRTIDKFAMDLTSAANHQGDSNETWPFVVIPDFDFHAGATAQIADLVSVNLMPLVHTEQLDDWNDFATANQQWRPEAIARREGIPVDELDMEVPLIHPQMLTRANLSNPNTIEEGEGPYFPIWQRYPVVDFANVNVNVYSHPTYSKPIQWLMATKQPVMPPSYDFWGIPPDEPRRISFQKVVEFYDGVYDDDPVVSMFYPVVRDLSDDDSEVVAVIAAHIYWRTYFEDILPPEDNGVIVVLENTCEQQRTYVINGVSASYMGPGDLHDPDYDELQAQTSFENIPGFFNDPAKREEAADSKVCLYGIRVYPSREYEEEFHSNGPLKYAFSVAAAFLFTSALFLLYDWCVERRQTIVLHSAEQSGAIVKSLFPDVVRDRMYKEMETTSPTDKTSKATAFKSNVKRTALMEQALVPVSPADGVGERGGAIANLYEDSSILFADIAGFTKWSSGRNPEDVFCLLETIYGAFDRMAVKRNVFKIETIGDCYVAATGIPKPQSQHAVIMTKFAQECLWALTEEIQPELRDKLGDDTAGISMRCGIHSGPVIAGVLKGMKSRFQIFGDTVNTTARMETSGEMGRIHVSANTAELLVAANKQSWLTKREKAIYVKGKGRMETFWVSIPSNRRGSTADTSTNGATTATTASGTGSEVSDRSDVGIGRSGRS